MDNAVLKIDDNQIDRQTTPVGRKFDIDNMINAAERNNINGNQLTENKYLENNYLGLKNDENHNLNFSNLANKSSKYFGDRNYLETQNKNIEQQCECYK